MDARVKDALSPDRVLKDVVIRREFTAQFLNAVMNDPAVRPWVAEPRSGILDLTEAVRNPLNVLLTGEYGAVLFFHLMPGIYEAHTQILPEGRGDWAEEFVHRCAAFMFTQTDAFEITTRVPAGHRAAARLALRTGMTWEFTEPRGSMFRGECQDVMIYSGRLQDWIKTAHSLEATGQAFHARLAQEAERLGVTIPGHEPDRVHNRYVGIAVAMMQAGQILKAINFYNRWAVSARHPVVNLVGMNPPRIKFDLGIMVIHGSTLESIEVILC